MEVTRRAVRFSRSLRFRLAVSYALAFSLLLVLLGLAFRPTLRNIMDNRAAETLNEEWGAVHGYLYFPKYGPDFFYDAFDPEEGLIVSRLKSIFFMADAQGNPVLVSDSFKTIGLPSKQEIESTLASGQTSIQIRKGKDGIPYMIRIGRIVDEKPKPQRVYFMAIGRSLADDRRILDRFARDYFLLLPVLIALCCGFGWFIAGRALEPLNSVSRTALRITSSKLGVQIPLRGADDELDHLIRAFNRMMERLNRSFEQIRQFSTDVSHELRTPLTVVRGQLEVALFTAKTTEQYREAMVNALEDVERLSSIVRALLLLSQSESGQLVLHKATFDLAETTRDLVDQFQIPAQEREIRLEAEAPETCLVNADRIQIERLLSNLLSNAIKYTQQGGWVRATLRQLENKVELVVADDGAGIAPEHLPHIFDRFYRVPSFEPEKGLGLGLSFVAWIVKAHDGKISVDSAPGNGSRFTVILPSGLPTPASQPSALTGAEKIH